MMEQIHESNRSSEFKLNMESMNNETHKIEKTNAWYRKRWQKKSVDNLYPTKLKLRHQVNPEKRGVNVRGSKANDEKKESENSKEENYELNNRND